MHSQRRRRRSVPAVVATALVAGLLATPVTVSEAATGSPAVRCLDGSAFLATIGSQDFCLRAFTTAGEFTWTVPEGIDSFEFLAVGGGGGGGGGAVNGSPFDQGGRDAGGGGGGGGAFFDRFTRDVDGREGADREIIVTVGAGGAGGTGAPDAGNPGGSDGGNGENTIVKWADDAETTTIAGAEGGKGGTLVDPGVENQEQPDNTEQRKGGAGGVGVAPLAAGGGGGRSASDGRTGGAGETTAFQSFWPEAASGSQTISGGGGGGASCGRAGVNVAQGGGSGGAGASSREAFDGLNFDFLPAVSGAFGGGGGGGAGLGSNECSDASTAGADGGDGAVFFRYAAFSTSRTSDDSVDIFIFVAAQDADPRTISIAGLGDLNNGVPTFTVEREGAFTFDIPADGVTTTPVDGDLTDSPPDVFITQDRGDGSFALRLYWTNPAGQESAMIQAERIDVRPEADDLAPFLLWITSEQFGFEQDPQVPPFFGLQAGPRTITTGLTGGAANVCEREEQEGDCRLQARLRLSGNGLEDIGDPERAIRARFVFTILDE